MIQWLKRKFELKNLPVKITEWIGSPSSILLHTIFFIVIFALRFFGISIDDILLILTTAVSLEAIYLAIFIQMTVNRNTESLEDVEENIDEIQEDIGELEKDIDEIQEDIDEIEKDDERDEQSDTHVHQTLNSIEARLQKIILEIEELKKEG